ncbi:MAG: hypothetical protein ACK5K7_07550 [Bacilli bacterium]
MKISISNLNDTECKDIIDCCTSILIYSLLLLFVTIVSITMI